jgi:hypothetical protein
MTADLTRMCALLSAVWPRNTAKRAARCAGVSTRTAEAWTTGRRSPAADTLLRMIARNDALAAELVLRLAAVRADRDASRADRAADVAIQGDALDGAAAVRGGRS